MIARRICLVLAALLVVLVYLESASEARCFKRRSVSQERKHASVVFSGEAIREEYRPVAPHESNEPAGAERLVIRFRVDRSWKGSLGEEAILYTSTVKRPDGTTSFMDEDFRFEVGKRYLVYAIGQVDRLSTNQCMRTAGLEEARADVTSLGSSRVPKGSR